MVEHVRMLGWIGLLRAAIGVGLGIVLLWKAENLGISSYDRMEARLRSEPRVLGEETRAFDQLLFRVVGSLCLLLASLRVIQGTWALVGRKWACALGLGLAVFDMVNLALFPISTALGLYGFVVYRHPDTLDHFKVGARP